jgi:hypothetical protein
VQTTCQAGAARDLQMVFGMKRRNVQQAFVGEGTQDTDQLAVADDGDDAVEFDLRGGRVMLTVPAGTPDDRVLEQQGYLTGELILEDGRRLSFEIQDGAVGAQWNVSSSEAVKSTDELTENVGLSTLEPPGGV